jgi:hypothetical protein
MSGGGDAVFDELFEIAKVTPQSSGQQKRFDDRTNFNREFCGTTKKPLETSSELTRAGLYCLLGRNPGISITIAHAGLFMFWRSTEDWQNGITADYVVGVHFERCCRTWADSGVARCLKKSRAHGCDWLWKRKRLSGNQGVEKRNWD